MREQVEKEYSLCSPSSIANASLPDFISAMTAVLSRCFNYLAADVEVAPSGSSPVVMFPLADVQNHAEDGNTHWRVGWASLVYHTLCSTLCT